MNKLLYSSRLSLSDDESAAGVILSSVERRHFLAAVKATITGALNHCFLLDCVNK